MLTLFAVQGFFERQPRLAAKERPHGRRIAMRIDALVVT